MELLQSDTTSLRFNPVQATDLFLYPFKQKRFFMFSGSTESLQWHEIG